MASRNNNRSGRIDEEFRRELSQIISFDLKNPSVTGMVSVTRVKVTPDLKYVTFNVSQTIKNIEVNKRAEFYNGGLIKVEEEKITNIPNLMGLEPAKDADLKVDLPKWKVEKYVEIYATVKDKEE